MQLDICVHIQLGSVAGATAKAASSTQSGRIASMWMFEHTSEHKHEQYPTPVPATGLWVPHSHGQVTELLQFKKAF